MKFLVALLVLATLAFVYAQPPPEQCAGTHHCGHEVITCHDNTHPACHEGNCECVYHATDNTGAARTCYQRDDCDELPCHDQHDMHCIDGHCNCIPPRKLGPQGGQH